MASQILKILLLAFFLPLFLSSDLFSTTSKDGAGAVPQMYALLQGKNSLDNGEYEKAIFLLSKSYEETPLLADYVLYWRAQAHEKNGNPEGAINDLNLLCQKFPDSSLYRNARKNVVNLNFDIQSPTAFILLKKYITDYTEDIEMKFAYALLLKDKGELREAKRLFKEIFFTDSFFSMTAYKQLSPNDITKADLLKKGENLNKVFRFKESEKYFREALSRKGIDLRNEILKGLADSLFRQKRYKESAELYKKIYNHFWYARSLLRTGDLSSFESELANFKKSSDVRMGNLLISYGNRKRRSGESETSFKIFKHVASHHPTLKEESLWAKGWTYYMMRDYENAHMVFSQLQASYSDPRYAYWKSKTSELIGNPSTVKATGRSDFNERDYYTMLNILKGNGKIPQTANSQLKISVSSTPIQRVDMLRKMELKKEALQELIHLSRKNPDYNERIQISLQMNELGNYKMSINLLSKGLYRSELHGLFYPLAFWGEIQEASSLNNIDPYLIISVMREESRFDEEARSIAGALGLMQLMPQTATRLTREMNLYKNNPNLYNPKINIMIGAYYLKNLLNEFNSVPAAVAAYNAGEHVVREWLKNGNYKSADEFIEDIPYDETRNYVKKVIVSYLQYQRTKGVLDYSAAFKVVSGF